MSSNNQRPSTMREMAQQGNNSKQLADWMKVVVNAFFLIPLICLFAYATGAWKFDKDDLDNIITSGCIFAGVGGLVVINFVMQTYGWTK